MFETFEFPPFAIKDMDFINNEEVLVIRHQIAEHKAPRLERADFCFAIGAPYDWTFDHSDDSCWVFLDQPSVTRRLRTREYQVSPPARLDDKAFCEWAADVRKYLQLSVEAPSLLCFDYADLLVLLKASPTQRLIAAVVDVSGLEKLRGASWTQRCCGLLHVAFYPDPRKLEEFFSQYKALGATPIGDTPVMGSIKIQPGQDEVFFLMAGIAISPS